jgi:hypothetical protein
MLSPQLAWATHCPFWHNWFAPQVPHMPPHASGPHCLPAHCFVQQALL